MSSSPVTDYDEISTPYQAFSESNAWNVHYDRPAILRLLEGTAAGQKILEVGCAAGALSEQLVERGHIVTIMDRSRSMLDLARARIGHAVDAHLGDISEPLDFVPDGEFDVIVASLVMHYVHDWSFTLREFVRALRPGGRFLMSTHHPCEDWRWMGRPNYFATELVTDKWLMEGQVHEITFYRRPLNKVFAAIRDSGLVVDGLHEPMPTDDCARQFPQENHILTTSPRFLYIDAHRPTGKEQF